MPTAFLLKSTLFDIIIFRQTLHNITFTSLSVYGVDHANGGQQSYIKGGDDRNKQLLLSQRTATRQQTHVWAVWKECVVYSDEMGSGL